MEELLQEVNLLPRNVLFIDDNPVDAPRCRRPFPRCVSSAAIPMSIAGCCFGPPELQVPVITEEFVPPNRDGAGPGRARAKPQEDVA